MIDKLLLLVFTHIDVHHRQSPRQTRIQKEKPRIYLSFPSIKVSLFTCKRLTIFAYSENPFFVVQVCRSKNINLFPYSFLSLSLLTMAASPVQVQNVLNLSALGVPPDQVRIILF